MSDTQIIIVDKKPNIIVQTPVQTPIISIGIQGPAGPAGSLVYQSFIAGQDLLGHTPVISNNSFQAIQASNDNITHATSTIGITTQAATQGAIVNVAIEGQTITEPSWTWIPNQALFLGLNGTISTTPPTTGFIQQIAIALSSTKILIRIQPAIILV